MKNRMKLAVFFIIVALIITAFSGVSLGDPEPSGARSNPRTSAPTLANDGVFPPSGNITTTFSFSVVYTDADGDWPTTIQVIIDGTPYTMSINGTNAMSGLYCYFNTRLTPGNHTYYFYTKNAVNETARLPTNGTKIFYVQPLPGSGNKPQLLKPLYSPANPVANQTINFTITYKDLDNDAPSYVQLYIKKSNLNVSYSVYTMTVTGNSYSTGVGCYKTLILTVGNYNYYFQTNSLNDTVTNPASGTYNLNVSISGGNPPFLSEGTVDPFNGTDNQTLFTYSVYYQDERSGSAYYAHVLIDEITHEMEQDGGPGAKGIRYKYSTYLTAGEHNYKFDFSDGITNVVLPASGVFSGPYVQDSGGSGPRLINGAVTPTNGVAYQTIFTYNVVYQDDQGNSPLLYHYIVIDNTFHTMSEVQGDAGALGTYYEYSTQLATGNHTYYFMFTTASRLNITLPANGVYYGPYVTGSNPSNRAPSASIIVTPLIGDLNTTFYFNGTGTDPDGDSITYYWSFSDGHRVSGHEVVSRGFNETGNYTATLIVTDPYGLQGITTVKVIVKPSNSPGQNSPPVIGTNLQPINYVKKDTVLYISALSSFDPDGDPLSFTWTLTNSKYNYSTIYRTGAFSHKFDLIGNYTLFLKVSDGKTDSSDTFMISCSENYRNQNPVAVGSVIVRGMVASLNAQGSYDLDGYIVSYDWQLEGSVFKGLLYNHTYTIPGYKTVTLVIIDNVGLTGSIVVGFYVNREGNESYPRNLDYNATLIGSHVSVEDSAEGSSLSVINSGIGFSISIIEISKNYLALLVDSESEEGRLVVVDIQKELFDFGNLEQIKLTMDNELVDVGNLEAVIVAAGDTPMYCIVDGDSYSQLLIYIPHFSSRIIEIAQKTDTSNGGSNLNENNITTVLPVLTVFVIVLIAILIIAFLQIKKKKESEYYEDFRVAEDKAQNGVSAKAEKEETTEWDDFI